ncbi:MAG: hypothetical protein HY814_01485 [Candidatus Riflebacteria bacterium]|nr:hypothetical protein [Candidatus Riflebacteria bacterium]
MAHACRKLTKNFLLRNLDSRSPTIARECAAWLPCNTGPNAWEIVPTLTPEEVAKLLNVAREMNPVEEVRLIDMLVRKGKTDFSQHIVRLAAAADETDALLRRPEPGPWSGRVDELPSFSEIASAYSGILEGTLRFLREKKIPVKTNDLLKHAATKPAWRSFSIRLLAELGDARVAPLLERRIAAGQAQYDEIELLARFPPSASTVKVITSAYRDGGPPTYRTDEYQNETVLKALEKIGTKEARAFLARKRPEFDGRQAERLRRLQGTRRGASESQSR